MSRHHVLPRRRVPRRLQTRPSVILWRWRHLIVGLCIGIAVLLALDVVRPAPANATSVVIAARHIAAGEIITDADLATALIPDEALPHSGLADAQVVGTRATITIEEGTVMTTAMSSGELTAELQAGERLVQVPITIGAQLAQPGSRVDVIAQSPPYNDVSIGENKPSILCHGARVVLTQPQDNTDKWNTNSHIALITLAVPSDAASLIVGSATHGALGVVLAP